MYYVYELSFDGYVFYVGFTNCPYNRYKKHAGAQEWRTQDICYLMQINGKLPDYKLVFHSPDKEATRQYEQNLILHYSNMKHKLCNIDYNDRANILDFPARKWYDKLPRLPKYWAKHIESYVQQYNSNI